MPQSFSSAAPSSAKATYRVRNWPEYNRALIARGQFTLWIAAEVLSCRRARRGKGKRYSDVAILAALCLRPVSGLTLRQTRGFLSSLVTLMDLTIEIAHYSTFSRWAEGLEAPRLKPRANGPVNLAIDATGLKMFCEGEWKMRRHGKDKRRIRRRLHPGVDTVSGDIMAHELTISDARDGPRTARPFDAHRNRA